MNSALVLTIPVEHTTTSEARLVLLEERLSLMLSPQES